MSVRMWMFLELNLGNQPFLASTSSKHSFFARPRDSARTFKSSMTCKSACRSLLKIFVISNMLCQSFHEGTREYTEMRMNGGKIIDLDLYKLGASTIFFFQMSLLETDDIVTTTLVVRF